MEFANQLRRFPKSLLLPLGLLLTFILIETFTLWWGRGKERHRSPGKGALPLRDADSLLQQSQHREVSALQLPLIFSFKGPFISQSPRMIYIICPISKWEQILLRFPCRASFPCLLVLESAFLQLQDSVCHHPSSGFHFVFNDFRLDFCLLPWVLIQQQSGFFSPLLSRRCSYISVRLAVILSLVSGSKINKELSVEAHPGWAGGMSPLIGFAHDETMEAERWYISVALKLSRYHVIDCLAFSWINF